jgi:hypothetical protein
MFASSCPLCNSARCPLKRKTGSLAASRFLFVRKPTQCRRHSRRRAPQKRCVNGFQNSRPGGVMFPPFRALATTLLLLLPYNPRCKRNFRYLEGRFSALYLGSPCDAPPWAAAAFPWLPPPAGRALEPPPWDEPCSCLVLSRGADVCDELCSCLVFSFGAELCPA